MISPEEIKKKALNKYWDVVRASLNEETIFPLPIRCQLVRQSDDLQKANLGVHLLRSKSKEAVGYGYSVRWEEKKSRKFGKNQFPVRIEIETREDFLKMVSKTNEYIEYMDAVECLQRAFPTLIDRWLLQNLKRFNGVVDVIEDLILVANFLVNHPRPHCYAREIPVDVNTKLVEQNKAILHQWLDLVLKPSQIVAEESKFEPRFGLRWLDSHVLIRFLDQGLQEAMGFPVDELTLPSWHVSNLNPPKCRLIIVENKISLLTLPTIPNTFAMLGHGFAVANYRRFQWLHDVEITYWGDLDVHGFEILSLFRALYPHTTSMFMDSAALVRWQHFAGRGKKSTSQISDNLTAEEYDAYEQCKMKNQRIEQEKIPHTAIVSAIRSLNQTDALIK